MNHRDEAVSWKNIVSYYLGSSYRRRMLDKELDAHKHYYKGVVLDIGGRTRGRFRKPKEKVEKWIFADINPAHRPDVVLDVCNMKQIENNSIDTINAIELFEHVESIEAGLLECHRILKFDGILILSAPFLYPIHPDPTDFQRLTEEKWRKILEKANFSIISFIITGRFFTVLADMMRRMTRCFPRPLNWFCYCLFPLLDILTIFDRLEYVQAHHILGRHHEGYFIICRK